MGWNAYAHGSAFHFVERVAAYRQAIGAAPASLITRLTTFPVAVATAAPAITGCAAVGAAALAVDGQVRARWAWPLASAIAILAFLVAGDLRDGAPTHHPERAVIPITWILAAFAADALVTLARRIAPARASQRVLVANAVAIAILGWCLTLPGRWADHPASSASESRDAQIARGLVLAAQPPPHVTVTPCDYEHFALIAAFGAPERVAIAPATHAPVTPACPHVELP
jgi:4-amino-4-deoxy-L-arabinose transferase-like glycosyltransferase